MRDFLGGDQRLWEPRETSGTECGANVHAMATLALHQGHLHDHGTIDVQRSVTIYTWKWQHLAHADYMGAKACGRRATWKMKCVGL